MDLQRINVKIFAEGSHGTSLTDFIPIFHSWIQVSDGEYYDVAEYSHVPVGPGVLLIAHEANISIDDADDRLGLLYNRKRPLAGSTQEKLQAVLKSALETCCKIEAEPSLGGHFKFSGEEVLVIINDRLVAPNTEETFQSLRPELESLAKTIYGRADFKLERDPDPRRRFSVRIAAGSRYEVPTLLKNLNTAGA